MDVTLFGTGVAKSIRCATKRAMRPAEKEASEPPPMKQLCAPTPTLLLSNWPRSHAAAPAQQLKRATRRELFEEVIAGESTLLVDESGFAVRLLRVWHTRLRMLFRNHPPQAAAGDLLGTIHTLRRSPLMLCDQSLNPQVLQIAIRDPQGRILVEARLPETPSPPSRGMSSAVCRDGTFGLHANSTRVVLGLGTHLRLFPISTPTPPPLPYAGVSDAARWSSSRAESPLERENASGAPLLLSHSQTSPVRPKLPPDHASPFSLLPPGRTPLESCHVPSIRALLSAYPQGETWLDAAERAVAEELGSAFKGGKAAQARGHTDRADSEQAGSTSGAERICHVHWSSDRETWVCGSSACRRW